MTNKQIATLELGLAEAISSHSTCGCRAKPVAIPSMRVSFADWIQGRAVASLGTNSGAEVLPFQGWRHFKEAFAPELIERAVAESHRPVQTCVDPFGGSGTTALACQFLGVHPIINEVNPFLADLIEAKLTAYSPDRLARDLGIVLRVAHQIAASPSELVSREAPATFIEPGDGERWIFDAKIAARIASLRKATDTLANEAHSRFFRVLLGGILVAVSNVVVSGKGRRYRRRWQERLRRVDDEAADTAGTSHRHERHPEGKIDELSLTF